MLKTYEEKRRKYYIADENFPIFAELASIMQKSGPGVEDVLFKNIDQLGDVYYACVTGYFTGATNAPTDLFIIGSVSEQKLEGFAHRIEVQIDREISYTPMTLNEYQYRLNFSDTFLRQLFGGPVKELINKLPGGLNPVEAVNQKATAIIRNPA